MDLKELEQHNHQARPTIANTSTNVMEYAKKLFIELGYEEYLKSAGIMSIQSNKYSFKTKDFYKARLSTDLMGMTFQRQELYNEFIKLAIFIKKMLVNELRSHFETILTLLLFTLTLISQTRRQSITFEAPPTKLFTQQITSYTHTLSRP